MYVQEDIPFTSGILYPPAKFKQSKKHYNIYWKGLAILAILTKYSHYCPKVWNAVQRITTSFQIPDGCTSLINISSGHKYILQTSPT